jgi:hypothetical protein
VSIVAIAMTYKFVPIQQIQPYIPEIEFLKVSKVARSPGQFLEQYKIHGKDLPEHWLIKREGFIKRMLRPYKLNPTRRRKLALLCWAYKV